MVKRKCKIRKTLEESIRKNPEKVLETGLNFYIIYVSSSVNQCNETKKNYAMMKVNVLKRVTLPNSRT